MEQKHILLSALGVGVGVGVGLGLVSGQTVSKWTGGGSGLPAEGINAEQIKQELLRLVVDGKDSEVNFDDFPYFLSERTQALLTSAAYVHLKHLDVSKHTRNLSPASRAILLSGPAEFYQQTLAKALAHHFEAKLLLLDITDFSLKSFQRSISEATLERMSSLIGSFSILPPKDSNAGALSRKSSELSCKARSTQGVSTSLKHRRNASVSSDISSIGSQSSSLNNSALSRCIGSWSFDEKVFLQSLYKVLVAVSETSCIILYIRDVERLFLQSSRLYKLFDRMLKKLSGSVLVLGSRTLDFDDHYAEIDERLGLLFPYNIEIRPPEDETHLISWKAQLEEDMKKIHLQDNKNHIAEVLAANDLECDDLESICHVDTMVLSNCIEEIVVSAISYHLMNNKDLVYRNGKLVISSNSLSHGLSIFQEGKIGGKDTLKLEANVGSSKDIQGEHNVGLKLDSKSDNPTTESKTEAEKSISSAKNSAHQT